MSSGSFSGPVVGGWRETLVSVDDIDRWVQTYAEVGGWEVRHEGVVAILPRLPEELGREGHDGLHRVGRPEADIGVVEYVLGKFDANQGIVLEPFLSRAIEAVQVILCQGAKEAMNRFNRKP